MVWLGIAMIGAVGIVWEDFKHRWVHLWWYGVLFIGLVGLAVQADKSGIWLWSAVYNVLFVLFLLLVLTMYFSIKKHRMVYLFDTYLGWGDVLFFVVITVGFNLGQYILFTIATLCIALVLTPIIYWTQGEERHVPLAGIQALCLAIYLPLKFVDVISLPSLMPAS